ncbi:MAG: M23 family metallopeptidase [Planctomycetota bacterium]|nr:hypothetical protein [Planctomycetota bacterium]MDP6518868.1 M23 family metallopeptidase [Planctomycetota bacterium]MDP6837970.1 M23 family metallopeptidase [Planctomycetota bacterium]
MRLTPSPAHALTVSISLILPLLALAPSVAFQGRGPLAPATPATPSSTTIDGAWESTSSGVQQLILRARADGTLLAYLPGSPGIHLASGSLLGSSVTLNFSGQDGGGASDPGTFTGTLTGHLLSGTLDDGTSSLPLVLNRSRAALTEEHWLISHADGGLWLRAGRLTESGAFVGGSFSGVEQCDFIACGGLLTDWTISGTAHSIATSSAGSCSSSSTLTGVFDAASALLTGSYTTTNTCSSSTGGDFMAGKEGLSTTAHAEATLELVATFCDALETESTTAIDALHSAYLHDGVTRSDWQAQFNSWFLNYDSIEADAVLTRIITLDDGELHPMLAGPARLEWRLTVSGVPAAGGARETLLDYEPAPFDDALHYLATESGRRVITGNGESVPFSMNMPLVAADGAINNYGIWPYGVHGGGHPEGHPGIDIEYATGTSVLAACAGTITAIGPNSHFPSLMDLMLEARPGVLVQYDHMGAVDPSLAVGSAVVEGQVLGDAPFSSSHTAVHFALRLGMDTTCPVPYLSSAGQGTFDVLWATAHYIEELVEPLPCNSVDAGFPLTAARTLVSGTLPPRLEITRDDPESDAMTYTLLDAAGVAFESGTLTINSAPGAAQIDFTPVSPAGPTRLGLVDILGPDLWLAWDTVSRPTSLSASSHYTLD